MASSTPPALTDQTREPLAGLRASIVLNSDQGGGVEKLAQQIGARLEREGARIDTQILYPDEAAGKLSKIAALFRGALRYLRTPADVTITFQPTAASMMGVLGPLKRCRVRIAHRANLPEITAAGPRLADRLIGSLGGFTINVANSTATEEAYAHYPERYRARMARIDHGIEITAPERDRNAVRLEIGVPLDKPLVVTASRLADSKAIDVFLKALPFWPEAHFAIAGAGELEEVLKAEAVALGITDRVHFLGFIDHQQLVDLFEAADLFVSPTRSETFGLSVAEAAAHRLPVLCRDLPVLHEVLDSAAEHERGGPPCAFLETDAPEAWAAAAQQLLSSPDLPARLDWQARNMGARFGEDVMLDAYVDLVKSQLGIDHIPSADCPTTAAAPSPESPATMFLLAHQDDEICAFKLIEDALNRGERALCVYMTSGHGAFAKASSDRRIRESRKVLTRLGVPERDIIALGGDRGIPDGGLIDHLANAWAGLTALAEERGHVCRVMTHAWEGGHPDHDSAHLLGLVLAQHLGVLDQSRQFPLYRAPGGRFRVTYASPLDANGPVELTPLSIGERLRYFALLRSYPSQTRVILKLAPFVAADHFRVGAQKTQRLNPERLRERPHPGQLLYESWNFYEFGDFAAQTARFLNSIAGTRNSPEAARDAEETAHG